MELEYSITGKPEKDTILFVHGAGANASQFEKQHNFFSEHYRVVSISLRGHGQSPKPSLNTTEQYALGLLANDILMLILKLNLNKIHYVGNSLGGVLGYLVITKSPALFLSLTTFGTTGQMNLPKFIAPIIRGIDYFMLRYFKQWYLRFVANNTGLNEVSKQTIYQMFLKATHAIPHIRYHLANYNYLDIIANLIIRYTLIQCEHDEDINSVLKTTLEAIKNNRNAKVVSLEGVGHIANLDNPDAFNLLLINVLSEKLQKNS